MNPKVTTLTRGKVREIIDQAVDLQTLPIVVLEAERLLMSRTTSAQDVANLLSRDPALAGRVLKLANSAYYGFRRRLGNLTQAIVVLGFQTVRNLMLTASVIERFQKRGSTFDYPTFWLHSIVSAIAAGEIGRSPRLPFVDQLYVCGLLHDVGKLVVVQNLPGLWGEVVRRRRAGEDEIEAERAVLGMDHSDIGAQLAQGWGLPEVVVAAIRDHHQPPSTGDEASPADVLHLAEILSACLVPGSAEDSPPLPALGLSRRLRYDAAKLAGCIACVETQIQTAAEFFELLGFGSMPLPPALSRQADPHEHCK